MIWGVEARHLWVPPGLADVFTPAEFVAGTYASSLRECILDFGPAVYLPLDATDGIEDQSGNNRDGAGSGGIAIGTAPALTPIPGDSATAFDGVNDLISISGYDAFVNGRPTTYMGIASRSSSSTVDPLFGGLSGTVGPRLVLQSGSEDVIWNPNSGNNTWAGGWPGIAQSVRWVLVFNEPADTASLYINGTLVATIAATAAFDVTESLLRIGSWSTELFGGSQSHFAIVERGLTAAEVARFEFFATQVTAAPITLNRREDDAGDPVYPQHHVQHISGLGATGDSGDRRDVRVGAQGEIPRRSYRRGKTITYEGLNKALTRADLRQMEEELTAAFDDQTEEGLMVVTPHPLYDASGDYRYFPARAMTAESDDATTFSPGRYTHGHESPFVVAVRNARAGGVSYYDQDGIAYP